MIRVIFYGISSLNRNINLTVGISILTLIVGLEGVLRPFKINCKNYQELIFMFNLQFLFIISLHNHNITYIVIMISLAAVHLFIIVMYHFSIMCVEIQQGTG